MGSTGMYVCALAQTMPVDAEDVVHQGGSGCGLRLFTDSQTYHDMGQSGRDSWSPFLFACPRGATNNAHIWTILKFNES